MQTRRRNKRRSQKMSSTRISVGGAGSRSKRRTKKPVKPACSLDRQNGFSCYNDEALLKIRDFWNARHPDDPIYSNDGRKIWTSLKKNLEDVCETESCWLRQKFLSPDVARQLRNYSFAPESPPSWKENPEEWLSSTDIERVMRQYEKAYPCFEFLGPSPVDYDHHLRYGECVWEELCKFDLQSLIKRGKFKIGIIFNLDEHWKPGSHWVSLFVNLKKNYIFYFDSAGDPPPTRIKRLIKTIRKQGDELGMNLEYVENDRAHQKGNNECGMYSLYAIATQLKDKRNPRSFLLGGDITDRSMNSLREKYFNPAEAL